MAGLAEASRADARRRARQREIQRNRLLAGGGVALVLVLVLYGCSKIGGSDPSRRRRRATPAPPPTVATRVGSETATTGKGLAPTPTKAYDGWVDPKSSGKPWSSKLVGQLTFRGNPTRSYYGLGPVPKDPKVLWRYPESGGMCGSSPVGNTPCTAGAARAGPAAPSVWEQDGQVRIAVGTYDKHIHFIDGVTGRTGSTRSTWATSSRVR